MTADEQHYLGHRQRLRERILKNPQEAEAYELWNCFWDMSINVPTPNPWQRNC